MLRGQQTPRSECAQDYIDQLTALPSETILQILELAHEAYPYGPHLTPQIISKALLPFTQRTLYTQIHIIGDRVADQFIRTLESVDSFLGCAHSTFVTSFQFTYPKGGNGNVTSDQATSLEELLTKVVGAVPNLRRLSIPSGLERWSRGGMGLAIGGSVGSLEHMGLVGQPIQWPPVFLLDQTITILSVTSLALTVMLCESDTFPSNESAVCPHIRRLDIRFEDTLKGSEFEALDDPASLFTHFPNVTVLRLTDRISNLNGHDSDCLVNPVPPALHSALLSTNAHLEELDISTASVAVDAGDLPKFPSTHDNVYEDFYLLEDVPRSKLALKDIFRRFTILTSLSFDGAAVDDRDLSFLANLPRLQRLTFGAFFDIRLAKLVEINKLELTRRTFEK